VADRLYRSHDDRVIAGVAGGVAEMVDADPSIIRVVWAVLVVLTGGLALLVYVVLAIVVPEGPVGGERRAPTPVGQSAGPVQPGGWVGPDGTVVPMATSSEPPGPARQRAPGDRSGAIIAGGILIAIGVFFLVRQYIPSIDPGLWWPGVAIGLGLVLVVLAIRPRSHPPT
jgi:phage shock protein C